MLLKVHVEKVPNRKDGFCFFVFLIGGIRKKREDDFFFSFLQEYFVCFEEGSYTCVPLCSVPENFFKYSSLGSFSLRSMPFNYKRLW